MSKKTDYKRLWRNEKAKNRILESALTAKTLALKLAEKMLKGTAKI